MKKWLDKFHRWKFDKKIRWIVEVTIITTTLLVLCVSTVSSVASMKEQSVELLQVQNNTVAENFRNSLDNYKTLAVATVLDRSVQRYVKSAGLGTAEIRVRSQNAYNLLDSIANMYSNLNFIAIVGDQTDSYLYKGAETLAGTHFLQVYQSDYEKCKVVENSTIRMGYNNAYYNGEKYTLNVYFPIYDTERIFKELGLLCMSFTDSSLQQILEYSGSSNTETFVLDTDGMLVASKNKEEIGQYVDYAEDIKNYSRSFTGNGKMYVFEKVSRWNFYVVSSVPMSELYHGSVRTVIIIGLFLLIILVICTKVIKELIDRLYKPLDNAVKKMDDVASGSLNTRIDAEYMGEDFVKLATGFNSMMEKIQVLMEQVKLEQHQTEQIRFNALQAQIQPHFLYNTLECIHWQAIADGNQEISTLVMALAKYYRICLSNGRDVISLEMELNHVQNYLIIQNMRYDDIIASMFDIESGVEDTMVPKFTLQPLVENSIYHGLKVKEGRKGTVSITAKKQEGEVLVTVSDTGTGMGQEQIDEMNRRLLVYDDSFGYGVQNVNKRIELLYGKKYGLHYLKNELGGVTVEIRMPYETEVSDSALRGEAIRV